MKVYFAGPDVFNRSFGAFKAGVADQCASLNLVPLFPGDEVTGTDPTAIFRDNISLIDRADAVVANLNPFRGTEADSGTVFELGYAFARGKKLLGYIDQDETIIERVGRLQGNVTRYGDDALDREGFRVENFGLPINLMLSIPTNVVIGNVYRCLQVLREDLDQP